MVNGPEKLTPRELIYSALIDAIDWQDSLSDSFRGSEYPDEQRNASDLAKQYRAMLKRRYGTGLTPMEESQKDAEMISIRDLSARTTTGTEG